jgi:SNF2 family DNA or RNA helicase
MLSRDNLHGYQSRVVDFIKGNRRCGVFLDMGLGKTTSTLTAALDLTQSFSVHKVLVVAPLRVANSVWAQEVAKWSHLKSLRTSICTGPAKRRLAALQMDADVYVINRENVEWLVEQYGPRWPFDMVVIDESSSFKNASSKRFKALRKVLPYTEYMVLLTGTPSPNGLLDLWAQIYLIDFGQSLGRTVTGYKQRFFEQDYMGYNFKPRAGAAEQIQNLISPFVMHMSAEDYLELPPRIDVTVTTSMPPAALEIYKNFERTLLAELDDGEQVEAVTAAVLANKLLQFANGGMYTDDKRNWSEIHTAKLDALAEIIEDNAGENILVSYNYKFDLERLLKRFPDAVVLDKQQETIDRWNRGEIRLLLAHPASAGHGLNIQAGGAIVVWFGLTWSLEHYLQFNARLHRQGQQKPVRIIHIVSEDTIDERVLSVLMQKDKVERKLLDALKPYDMERR